MELGGIWYGDSTLASFGNNGTSEWMLAELLCASRDPQ
jgi:hypothetical protein